MRTKGDDWKEGREQEYFLEIEYAGQSIDSEVINVNDSAPQLKVETGRSMQSVGKIDKQEERETSECFCKKSENQFYWSNKLTCEQRKKVLQVCASLWGEDKKNEKASELMSIIHVETSASFLPSADNGAGYSGLIQFSDASAKGIGSTRTKLKAMTFVQQMDYVEKYLSKNKDKLTTMTDLYLMVLKPNAVGQGNNSNFILFDESITVPDVPYNKDNLSKEPWVTKYGYASNPTYMAENGEYTNKRQFKTYSKGIKEKRGFTDGKTYVWEVTQVLKQQHYDLGKSNIFNAICETKPKETRTSPAGKAPWMPFALAEFSNYKGLREIDSPLKEKISIYFEISSAKGLKYDYSEPWCGAFIVWCFEQTRDYKNINNAKSAAAFGWKGSTWAKGESCEAFVGATIIFDFSHVAFIVGENNDGTKYIYLGGNQGNGEKRSGYQKICMGSVSKTSKTILDISKPTDYTITEEDKKLPKYDINEENSKASSR